MATTTIQVTEETADLLKRYKEQNKLKTYDEAIRTFMSLKAYSRQFRGFLGKKGMKYVMEGLRDKKDRF